MEDRLRLDDQLCFALYAATNAVTRTYRPLLRTLGLTYPQYLVMLALWQDGDSRVQEIAARLELSPSAVSPLLDRLEEAGLVKRQRDAADRRVVHLSLTEAGAKLESAALEAQREVACRVGLSTEAYHQMRSELRELALRLERTDEPRTPCFAS